MFILTEHTDKIWIVTKTDVSDGQIWNDQIPRHGSNQLAYSQCNIKENWNIQSIVNRSHLGAYLQKSGCGVVDCAQELANSGNKMTEMSTQNVLILTWAEQYILFLAIFMLHLNTIFNRKYEPLRNVNSLWPSVGMIGVNIGSGSLTVPSHYLNQCWLIIDEARWHLNKGNITETVTDSNHCKGLENYIFENTATSSRGQWVTG